MYINKFRRYLHTWIDAFCDEVATLQLELSAEEWIKLFIDWINGKVLNEN